MNNFLNKISVSITCFNQILLAKFTKFVFSVFTDFEIEGKENLEKNGQNSDPAIFVANHTTELDAFLIGSALSFKQLPIYFITKPMKTYGWRGWRRVFYNDQLLRLIGSQPAGAGLKNYEESLKKHLELLSKGYNMAIFPEGKRASDGQINKNPRGGAVFLSYKTKTPVIPIGISGVFNISLKKLLFKRIKVLINIGEPIEVSDYLPEDREPTVDEIKYVSYQLMHHKVKPLVNFPAAPDKVRVFN